MTATVQYCTFWLDNLYLGVDVRQVQEVIRYQAMTRVPLAARMVRGLINLRGQIVTAVDLRECLAMPPRDSEDLPMNVVVRGDDGAVSLLVDKIGDVFGPESDTLEPPPETLGGNARQLIRGVHRLAEGLLLVLDTKRILCASGA